MSSSEPRKGRPRGSTSFAWRAFFQQTRTPVFVLGKGRRLRYANTAWEALTGVKLADALGMVCSTRRDRSPLASALAPPPEVLMGQPGKSRRAAPPQSSGPPWWNITFAPMASGDGLLGVVGFIVVVGEIGAIPSHNVPASVMAERAEHAQYFSFDLFAGNGSATARFVSQLRLAAKIDAPVWLVGEAGSGKETAARVIHHMGAQCERAFVGLDCAGLQPYLIESLFTGHGGVLGSGGVGTVYLKEPSELPRDLQERFAELFTESPVRIICGSTRTASEDVAAGKLVSAFHTTLAVLELSVPPLRERLDELPRLAAHFLAGLTIEATVLEMLKSLPWPGNLRELGQVLGEAATSAAGANIKREHLPWDLRVQAGLVANPPTGPGIKLDATLEAIEKKLLQLAMARANGNATKAAELLGIWRPRLLRRIDALGLST